MPALNVRKFMLNAKKRYIALVVLVVLLCIAIGTSMALHQRGLNLDLDRMVREATATQLEQQRMHLQTKLQNDMCVLEDFASIVCYTEGDQLQMQETINGIVAGTSFASVAIVDENGKGILNDGTQVDVFKQAFFTQASEGKTTITMPTSFIKQIEGSMVVFATPVLKKQSESFVLMGAYPIVNLHSFVLPAYRGEGLLYLTDDTGSVVLGPAAENLRLGEPNVGILYDLLKGESTTMSESARQLAGSMRRGETGSTTFTAYGSKRILQYTPLGVGNWYLSLVVPESAVTSYAQGILQRAGTRSLLIWALFLVLMGYILWLWKKSAKEKTTYLRSLETMAYYDALTGVPNLHGFKRQVAQMLKNNPRAKFALSKFDVSNFKGVNQMFGFAMGNVVLKAVCDALEQMKVERDLQWFITARVNADEFMVFDECSENERELSHRKRHFEMLFREKVRKLLCDYKIDLRYGRCYLLPGDDDVEGALEKANLAHHSAKTSEYVKICEYEESMKAGLVAQLSIEHRMEAALKSEAFQVFLQPKYALSTETMTGAEALVRWKQDDGTLLSPNDFIPLFERNGFIVQLDFYMFEHVCKLLHDWLGQGKQIVPVSVNFSRLHLNNSKFVQQLESIADQYEIPRQFLEIELTESVFFQNQEALQELLILLHAANFMLSMDDFGTGYSSLGLLKNLPVDTIKMDRSFFDESNSTLRARLVIESVILMAKKLGIHTVAEGVETQENIDFLRQVGCDIVQGFYYARPMATSEFFNELL